MTPSGGYKTRSVRRRPEFGALGLRVPHDVEGYAVEPESGGSRCTTPGYAVPMPAPAPVPQVVVAAGTGGPCSEQVVHQEIRCAEICLQHELSWMQISDDGHDGSCAH